MLLRNHLLIMKILPLTLLEACFGFQIAAFDSKKLFRKPPVIQKIVQKPAVTCTLEAITNDSKGKLDQKFVMRLLEESSGLVSVFKEAKLFNYFSLLNIYKFHRKA
jgi:hypothetical protein